MFARAASIQGALSLLARVALAAAFLWAGVVKLASPEVFAVTVRAFGLLPDALIGPLSVALPVLEVAAGLLLLLGTRGAVPLSAGLLALFIAVLVYALRMGLDIDCGCYGPSDPEREAFGSIRQALWRDLAMLAGLALVWWQRKHVRRQAR